MKITEKRLAEMWCELNKYLVPKELKGMSPIFNHGDDAMGAMKLIESLVGKENCLKEWNQDQLDNPTKRRKAK